MMDKEKRMQGRQYLLEFNFHNVEIQACHTQSFFSVV